MIITTGSIGKQRSITLGSTAQWSAASDLIPTKGSVLINTETGYMRLADGMSSVANLPVVEVTAMVDVSAVTISTIIHGTDITI